MRSRSIQALRPLRSAASTPCLRHSAPTRTPSSSAAPMSTAATATATTPAPTTTATTSRPAAKPFASTRVLTPKSSKTSTFVSRNTNGSTTANTGYNKLNPANRPPSEQPVDMPLDPQVAVPPAASVDDFDPSAGRVPSPSAPAMTTNSTPVYGGGGGGNGNGNGNGNGGVPGSGGDSQAIDWSSSFHGLSTMPFGPEVSAILMQPLDPDDIEIKPDGIIYLPEIKYRRILNKAFGPGGWGLAPRGPAVVADKRVTQEYALIVHGRFIAQARGECQFFGDETIPTAQEGCKSNALMRCCKDLGISSELWDPRFIRDFKKKYGREIWVEHVVTKKRRQIWTRKDCDPAYPFVIPKKV